MIGARNDLTLEIIQCSKERDRPVPVIVMGPSLDVTGFKRQTGLRTAQGPNLASSHREQALGLVG